MTHPIYPGGPPCLEACPGEWSQYHDGYADGYERGEEAMAFRLAGARGLVAQALDILETFGEGLSASEQRSLGLVCERLGQAEELLRPDAEEGASSGVMARNEEADSEQLKEAEA